MFEWKRDVLRQIRTPAGLNGSSTGLVDTNVGSRSTTTIGSAVFGGS